MDDFETMLFTVLAIAICTICAIGYRWIVPSESKKQEEKKRKEDEEKKDSNSLYNRLVKTYNLATDEFLSMMYNKSLRMVLEATTYTMNDTLFKQQKALLDTCHERERKTGIEFFENSEDTNKNEYDEFYHFEDTMKEHYTLEETLELISYWTDNYKRPDIIQVYLLKIVDNECLGKNDDEKAKIYLPIIRETNNFINTYERTFKHIYKMYEERTEVADQQYSNRTAEGLGFGIISSSISQIALHSALDTYEKNKELKRQETQIWSQMNDYSNASIETFIERITDEYKNKYSEKIKSAINEAYELLYMES